MAANLRSSTRWQQTSLQGCCSPPSQAGPGFLAVEIWAPPSNLCDDEANFSFKSQCLGLGAIELHQNDPTFHRCRFVN